MVFRHFLENSFFRLCAVVVLPKPQYVQTHRVYFEIPFLMSNQIVRILYSIATRESKNFKKNNNLFKNEYIFDKQTNKQKRTNKKGTKETKEKV